MGFDRTIHYGKMMVTDMGKELINTGRFPELYDEEMNCEFVEEIYKFLQIENRGFDWRELGIRVALYDDLRERRFTQPTGVDWSIAKLKKNVSPITLPR